jgi:glyoxylase-like metal-dependent hydrolase (beta-lactamase superfamily II)
MDVQEIAPHLWHWTAPHPDWKPSNRGKDGLGWDQVVSSYALITEGQLVLIDPQLPSDDADLERFWEALDRDVEGHGPPSILISIHWHERSAQEIAERYPGSTIWAPADARGSGWTKGKISSTHTYAAGDELPAGIEVHDLGRVKELVLYLPSHKALVFGDVILDGVRICPESWLGKGTTRKDAADELRPLLEKDIELLLLTHGGPVAEDARGKLERALEV